MGQEQNKWDRNRIRERGLSKNRKVVICCFTKKYLKAT